MMDTENKGSIHVFYHLTGTERLTHTEAVVAGERTQVVIPRQCFGGHIECQSEGSIIESNTYGCRW